MQPQIVHEAEIHRQHVRLKIPIQVDIDGTRFSVDDWSMGGFGIESEITSRRPGERFPVRLAFPFEDFEITLRLDCQMVYILEDNSRFGCRFLGLAQGQAGLFRYLVDAYLAGEVVGAGDVLSVRGRENTAEARAGQGGFNPYEQADTAARKARRIAGYTILALVGAGLAGLVWLGVQDRFLTIRAASAAIEAPITRVRAPAAGVLQPMESSPLVSPGNRMAMILASDGSTATVTSPCECILLDWTIAAGQFVQIGEEVAVLVAADKPLLVRAQVALEDVDRLEIGDPAEIVIPGRDEIVGGQIDRIDIKPQISALAGGAPAPSRRMAQVSVRPDRPFEFEDLGSLVTVTFP